MRRRALLALAAAALLAAASPTQARAYHAWRHAHYAGIAGDGHRLPPHRSATLVAAVPAEASRTTVFGRGGPSAAFGSAPYLTGGAPAFAVTSAWDTSSAIVAEADRHVGWGKFTGLPGPWCADFVSAMLQDVGKRPLPNRLAASALDYGPPGSGSPGDLAVFLDRRGRPYHVGIVAPGGDADHRVIVSGNWGHRVARAVVPVWGLRFVRT